MSKFLSPYVICRYLPLVSEDEVQQARKRMASVLLDHRVMPPEVSAIARTLSDYHQYRWLNDPESLQPGRGKREEWWYVPRIETDEEAEDHRLRVLEILTRHGFSEEEVAIVFAAARVTALAPGNFCRLAGPPQSSREGPH